MIQPKITADGSHTLYVPELDEHYHSVNGAIQESVHVYLNAGFNQCNKTNISVLEIGFGTGLNALLTALEAQKRNITADYTSLEKYPLDQTLIEKLNYDLLDKEMFLALHTCPWSVKIPVASCFSLTKIETDLCTYTFRGNYDVVYYDAFGPDKQPEVWSQDIFNKIYGCMNNDGILTTYCAKGEVRRMLLQTGFTVERIPGPPGKREMLRARKMG